MKNAIKRVQPSTRAQAERSQARLNYAERSILHEVKRVLLFLIVLSTAMAMSAQKYKPNTKWPYLYADFTDGTIYFDSNQKTQAQLNIHLMGNKLHYVSSDQKILEAETRGIIRVEIGNDAYIYSDDQLVKILAVEQNNLVVEVTKADFDALFSGTGAYGASLNSSASRDLSSLDLGGLDSPELGRLLQEREEEISNIVKRVGVTYAHYFNKKYDRSGHLFQDRFRSEPVDSIEYFVTLLRYIHQNPVKAGIVEHVVDYRWSSWSEYSSDNCLTPICATKSVFARIQKDELNELVCTILEEYEEILDIENESTKQLSDDEIKDFLLQSQGITNPLMIQSLEKVRRNEILITAKAMGAGLRQLSRLTGVSFGVIQKL